MMLISAKRSKTPARGASLLSSLAVTLAIRGGARGFGHICVLRAGSLVDDGRFKKAPAGKLDNAVCELGHMSSLTKNEAI